MKNIHKILLVCSGNSCRSIMAEAYLKHRLAQIDLPIEVRSAGTLGLSGTPPSKEAIKVIEDEGIDSKGYESKALTEESIRWADVVLVMETMHWNKVVGIVPEAEDKTVLLGSYNGESTEDGIPDPIGRPIAFYRAAFASIKKSIEEFILCLEK